MKKQILFAHSGGPQGSPGLGSYDFISWLEYSLGKEYQISCPIIEDPEAPSYSMWKSMLNKYLDKPEQEFILIGHSLGGAMLLKYLSEETIDSKINALHLVAVPFFGKTGWNLDDFALKKDFTKSLPPLNAVHLFHCTNDPIVPLDHLNFYGKSLTQAIVHELEGNSHVFSDGLPELLQIIRTSNYPDL